MTILYLYQIVKQWDRSLLDGIVRKERTDGSGEQYTQRRANHTKCEFPLLCKIIRIEHTHKIAGQIRECQRNHYPLCIKNNREQNRDCYYGGR